MLGWEVGGMTSQGPVPLVLPLHGSPTWAFAAAYSGVERKLWFKEVM